jgi:hypothetical protein
MKFAIVNKERHEAQSGLIGKCPACGWTMTPKCGRVRINHWAHKGSSNCDPWQSKVTEWHRNWQNQFPIEWQEIKHQNLDTGELHFADVKTSDDWVIEFQHSFISPDEKKSREDFYRQLIWVVNGSRRLNDAKRFFKILGNLNWKWGINKSNPDLKITIPEGSLLKEWVLSKSHVLFDFGEENLWWLHPESNENIAYLMSIKRLDFIYLHKKGDFASLNSFEDSASKYKEILVRIGIKDEDKKPAWMSIPFERHSEDIVKKLIWLNKKPKFKKN